MSNYDFPVVHVTIFAGTANERRVQLTMTEDDHIHAQFGHREDDQQPLRFHSSEYTFSAHLHADAEGKWDIGRDRYDRPDGFYINKAGDHSAYPSIAPTHKSRMLEELLRAVNESAPAFAAELQRAEEQKVAREVARRENEIETKRKEIATLEAEIAALKSGNRERRMQPTH